MNSGSIVPADPLDCPKAQHVYDTIVDGTGCTGKADTLQCLRDTDLQTLLEASTQLPTFLSYDSIALSFLPRPDGTVLTKSPEFLLKEGKFAKVPVIIGDEEDEGTLWSLTQFNLTTPEDLAEYLNLKFFHHATRAQMNEFVGTYQTITEDGSPYRTGEANNWYPQYKRVAAMLGDLAFTLSRRYFLNERHAAAPELKSWSYMSSYFEGIPILGTVHGSDIFHIVWSVPYDFATNNMHEYYLSFINYLDPNVNNNAPTWPTWEDSNQLLNSHALWQQLIPDTARSDSYEWIADHVPELTM
jgi:triacylglycerol lipase